MNTEIDQFRKEYKRQKRIEEIVLSRVLSRPKIKKWHVCMFFAIYFAIIAIIIGALLSIKLIPLYKILLSLLLIIFISESYLRFCLIQVVKCYQHYASDEVRRTCKCVPSCSEYAIYSLKAIFPLMLALLKIRKRLYVTCDGKEYRIDFPTKNSARFFDEIQ